MIFLGKHIFKLFILIILITIYPLGAHGAVTYNYQGNNYVYFQGDYSPEDPLYYDDTMSLSGSFTTSSVLSSNTYYDFASSPDPEFTFSFYDGSNTTYSSDDSLDRFGFRLSTDSNGDIDWWMISMARWYSSIFSQTNNDEAMAWPTTCFPGMEEPDCTSEAFANTGGTWSSPSVVPEPISSTLFLIGGATLGFRRFRKTIKN